MGTHPIFESDFDCLTASDHDLPSCPCRPTTSCSGRRPTSLRLRSGPRYWYRRQVHWCRSCYRRSRWIWSRYRNCVRFPHHRLRPKPIPQGSALLLRHSWIRPLRSHGSLLFDGCLPHPLRFVNSLLCVKKIPVRTHAPLSDAKKTFRFLSQQLFINVGRDLLSCLAPWQLGSCQVQN